MASLVDILRLGNLQCLDFWASEPILLSCGW